MDKKTEARLKRLEALEQKKKLKEGLPHLYGFPFYKWARDFFESRNRFNFLCAGNQLSKSSSMIRKAIHWATAQDLWPSLWITRPSIFWYFYPTKEVGNVEFCKKWVTEFLPRNEYKDHPVYGWKSETDSKKLIQAIHFNSGVSIYFKAYAQGLENLQTSSCHAVFADEELPEEYFSEIRARLTATRGYYHTAFTATLGQEIWRATMEDKGPDVPFPTAWKRTVSMWDCQYYEDGTPSPWTKERIEEEIASCINEREVQRRIYGRFVKAEGLAFPGFERHRNLVKFDAPPPKEWHVYSGVDIGSGGPGYGHPSAMVFIAVRPDFKFARIFRGCRMDKVITTAGDTYQKYVQLRDTTKCVVQSYDYSCKDFQTIASRNNDAFTPADKARDKGNQLLNTLFRSGMLVIDADVPELLPLVRELEGLIHSEHKTKAADDFCDATRYAAMPVPWDYIALRSGTADAPPTPEQKITMEEERRGYFRELDLGYNEIIESEISDWNDCYEV